MKIGFKDKYRMCFKNLILMSSSLNRGNISWFAFFPRSNNMASKKRNIFQPSTEKTMNAHTSQLPAVTCLLSFINPPHWFLGWHKLSLLDSYSQSSSRDHHLFVSLTFVFTGRTYSSMQTYFLPLQHNYGSPGSTWHLVPFPYCLR